MNTLLIIDVQNSYMEWILQNDLLTKIPQLSQNYSNIYYLWDNVSGQDLYDELPQDWIEGEFDEDGNEIEDTIFYNRVNKVIDKQYGFFRGLMDHPDTEDDDIILLGKFILKHNLYDCREIFNDSETEVLFKKEFKNSPLINIDFESYTMYVPTELLEDLSENTYTLVGGGLNECLKEVSLLLKIGNIEHTIIHEYCY